jgi:hypothetical protein
MRQIKNSMMEYYNRKQQNIKLTLTLSIISISIVFLIHVINFTFGNQNALAQNSLNIISSSDGASGVSNSANVNISSLPSSNNNNNNNLLAKSIYDTA